MTLFVAICPDTLDAQLHRSHNNKQSILVTPTWMSAFDPDTGVRTLQTRSCEIHTAISAVEYEAMH